MPITTFDNRAKILKAVLLLSHWSEDKHNWKYFAEYNDLGLPLAFAYANGIVPQTDELTEIVDETWEELLKWVGVEDDAYEEFEDLLENQEQWARKGWPYFF